MNLYMCCLCVAVSSVLRGLCPECDGAVSGGGQEGELMCVPSTLDHFISMLSNYSQRQLLRQVTLQVSDDDLVVVGSSEQVMSSR